MKKAGYSLHDITQVRKHKNIESLRHYLDKPTREDMENYTESLFRYTEKPTLMPATTIKQMTQTMNLKNLL